jgi:hypothetical protein
MLRWIAVLVVLVNVIYFAVNYTAGNAPLSNSITTPVATAAPSLVLLAEKKNPLAVQPVAPVVAAVKSVPVAASESEPEAESKSEPEVLTPPAGDQSTPPAVTFPLPNDEAAVANESKAASVDVASKAESPPVVERCWEVGKLSGEDEAKQLVARLAATGHTLALQKRAVQGEPDYWVFLGPYANRRQALAAHRDLQVRKIDSFMINEGELENAVSLGLFSLEAGAQTIQQQRKKQGLDAKIRAVPRTRNEWWGILKQADGQLPDSVRELILAGQADSAIEIKNLGCELIANTEKLD